MKDLKHSPFLELFWFFLVVLLSAFLTFAPFTAFLVLEVVFLDFSLLDAFLGGYKKKTRKLMCITSTIHTSFPYRKIFHSKDNLLQQLHVLSFQQSWCSETDTLPTSF